jgi:tetratricopeptide (TPR) repeat protein
MQIIDIKIKEATAARRAGRTDEAASLADAALVAARESGDCLLVAYTLRHTADVHSQLGHSHQAADEITEAIRIYREHASDHTLDLANALRISALNAERGALAAWQEAKTLYALVDVQAGIDGATQHVQHLSASLGGIS